MQVHLGRFLLLVATICSFMEAPLSQLHAHELWPWPQEVESYSTSPEQTTIKQVTILPDTVAEPFQDIDKASHIIVQSLKDPNSSASFSLSKAAARSSTLLASLLEDAPEDKLAVVPLPNLDEPTLQMIVWYLEYQNHHPATEFSHPLAEPFRNSLQSWENYLLSYLLFDDDEIFDCSKPHNLRWNLRLREYLGMLAHPFKTGGKRLFLASHHALKLMHARLHYDRTLRPRRFFELMEAANYLQIDSLLALTGAATAALIIEESPQKIKQAIIEDPNAWFPLRKSFDLVSLILSFLPYEEKLNTVSITPQFQQVFDFYYSPDKIDLSPQQEPQHVMWQHIPKAIRKRIPAKDVGFNLRNLLATQPVAVWDSFFRDATITMVKESLFPYYDTLICKTLEHELKHFFHKQETMLVNYTPKARMNYALSMFLAVDAILYQIGDTAKDSSGGASWFLYNQGAMQITYEVGDKTRWGKAALAVQKVFSNELMPDLEELRKYAYATAREAIRIPYWELAYDGSLRETKRAKVEKKEDVGMLAYLVAEKILLFSFIHDSFLEEGLLRPEGALEKILLEVNNAVEESSESQAEEFFGLWERIKLVYFASQYNADNSAPYLLPWLDHIDKVLSMNIEPD